MFYFSIIYLMYGVLISLIPSKADCIVGTHIIINTTQELVNRILKYVFLTLLSFSPSWCGMSVRKFWKPAFIDCIRRLSLELAISLRIRFSCSIVALICGVLWPTTMGVRPVGGESTPSSDALVRLQEKKKYI